ncbi:hypothetical protein J4Q44_G00246290 [Coregonus suidteri]|uniref:Uncharacterized protein n=1 Tax=Coregonus suidteri TaxID=861788 RepID=A0AAN8LBE0_9TELE
MSLKKRLPLRSVQTNSLPDPEPTPDPTWESLQANQKTGAVCQLTRSARSHIGGVYQRLQRNRAVVQDQEECLVVTPGRVCEGTENSGEVPSRTPRRTPVRSTTLIPTTTPRRTPRATAPKRRGSPEVTGVKNGGGRRQLVRMAALRSPFASPNTQSLRRKFGRDLESVSSGLRKLKRLSHAFDDVIERDDRTTFSYSLISE